MKLTVLAEDHPDPEHPDLNSDHGFSLLAEMGDLTILYDFGSDGSLSINSEKLGIDLGTVNSAILSHGHYDHSGGIGYFLSVNPDSRIHHGRGAFHHRWSISRGSPKEVGISLVPTEEVVERLSVVDSLIDNEEYVILPAAPGHRARPAGNASLLAGPEGNRLQDDFTDELTLVLRGDEGLVVVTGCSHRGILNIVDQVRAYCPKCPIRALIGGFHLVDADESDDSLRSIGAILNADLAETEVFTGHCTGSRSASILAEMMGQRIKTLHVGMVLNF